MDKVEVVSDANAAWNELKEGRTFSSNTYSLWFNAGAFLVIFPVQVPLSPLLHFMFVDEKHVFDQLLMKRLCETLAKPPPFHQKTVTELGLRQKFAEGTTKDLKKEFSNDYVVLHRRFISVTVMKELSSYLASPNCSLTKLDLQGAI